MFSYINICNCRCYQERVRKLNVIYETKLLGIIITSDLRWNAHVKFITGNATKRLWLLIRFKNVGGTEAQLLTVYELKIRSLLEFAAPVFHSSLTEDQSNQIELIQKKALAIILGNNYHYYQLALTHSKLERLDLRRENLCNKFAIKCTKDPRHSSMFPLNNKFRSNMRCPKKYLEYQCRTTRYFKSALPYLSRLLNKIP